SPYGLNNAAHLAGQLACLGMTVVSGMARGIDTSAHRGALKASGRTIAVIGSGMSNLYPPENARLCEEIAAHGAVISEFPMRCEPCKQNFPRRNRLISGLSLGVLVVEACRNSGALITAGFAAEQGRDVFALPGNIDAAGSFGTNQLIQQGAKLVTRVEDIIEEMPFVPCQEKQASAIPEGFAEGLSCTERLLYTIISAQDAGLDELAEQTGLNIQDISAALVQLQLKKKVRQAPGGFFMRSQDAG
ncbi:MAG: DNA-processing protein DprA, partial [Candidatus Omnitrophica bacterium]|nr:DNA-processing protein DprA [Candidatus Omnitrophota bacterium]